MFYFCLLFVPLQCFSSSFHTTTHLPHFFLFILTTWQVPTNLLCTLLAFKTAASAAASAAAFAAASAAASAAALAAASAAASAAAAAFPFVAAAAAPNYWHRPPCHTCSKSASFVSGCVLFLSFVCTFAMLFILPPHHHSFASFCSLYFDHMAGADQSSLHITCI